MESNQNEISKEIKYLEEEIGNLWLAYDKGRETLLNKIREVRTLCDHSDKTYHPDASGNNDSHYECNTCGKIAKKL